MKPFYESEYGKLYFGDCLEIMPSPQEKVELVLTDPPYGTTQCKWDSVIPFDKMWEQLKRVIAKKGAICLFASQPFTSSLVESNKPGFVNSLVWLKGRGFEPALAKLRPQKAHEDIVVFSSDGKSPSYYPQMVPREKPKKIKGNYSNDGQGILSGSGVIEKTYTERYPLSYFEFGNSGQSKKLHPTQKPVALMEYLIRTYTNFGDTVLDFTIGSGTTAVAAINTGRKFIGIEKEEKYCEIAKQRIIEAEEKMIEFEV